MPQLKKPTTVYAVLDGGELALVDSRLPLFWRRDPAKAFNEKELFNTGTIVQVTVSKRRKSRKAKPS